MLLRTHATVSRFPLGQDIFWEVTGSMIIVRLDMRKNNVRLKNVGRPLTRGQWRRWVGGEVASFFPERA